MDFESDLGTLERIIMQFWPKEATQYTSDLPIDDPLPTQKKWSYRLCQVTYPPPQTHFKKVVQVFVI